MKVIFPVVDNQEARNIMAKGFHNTKFVCIYDCETHNYEWLATNEISEKPGNLTIGLKKRGIYTVISLEMPLMALGLFVESGFTVYKAQGSSVEENIRLFSENQLKTFPVYDAFVSECGGSCSSCSSVSCN